MSRVHRISVMLAFAALASQSACETTTRGLHTLPRPSVASVSVYPASITLLVGETGMVRSVVRDSTGGILWGQSPTPSGESRGSPDGEAADGTPLLVERDAPEIDGRLREPHIERLERLDQDLRHGEVAKPLLVGRNDIPRRFL